jgi:hypothetical protein
MVTEISTEEYMELTNVLKHHHNIFYKMWLLGRPQYDDTLKTAAVTFDREGHCIRFSVNPTFWADKTLVQKAFIISHECQHVIREHGSRFIKGNHDVANVAMDITINHDLVKYYEFVRSEIDPESNYCWIDTIFKDPSKVLSDQSFEYYYNLLINDPENSNTANLVDDHEGFGELSHSDAEAIADIIQDQFSPDELDEAQKIKTDAGHGPGGRSTIVDNKPPVIKKKWETVVKNWSKKYLIPKEKEESQWVHAHRRHSLLDDGLFLPSDMEVDLHDIDKTKIDVLFFLDTSGSCRHLAQRFFTAAKSLDPRRFELHLYCFDTKVYPTTLESRKLYGFGGTYFHPIGYVVEHMIKAKQLKDYVVFVLTDGDGSNLTMRDPSKWHWFLSTNYTNYIPKGCNIHKLSNYE